MPAEWASGLPTVSATRRVMARCRCLFETRADFRNVQTRAPIHPRHAVRRRTDTASMAPLLLWGEIVGVPSIGGLFAGPPSLSIYYYFSYAYATLLAERAGFEPALGYYPKHAFQACDLNHSSISPQDRGF